MSQPGSPFPADGRIRARRGGGRRRPAGRRLLVALVAATGLASACGSGPTPDAPPDAAELVSDVAGLAGLDDDELAEELAGADPAAELGAWHALEPVPVADPATWRTLGAIWTGDRVLLLGGDPSSGAGARTELFSLDPAVGRWESRTTLVRSPQSWTRLAWVAGHLVVVGGDAPGSADVLRVDAWDAATDTWSRGPDVPLEPRGGFTLTATDREVVLFGGVAVTEGTAGPGTRVFGDGASWQPGDASWQVLPPAPVAPRASHAAVWTGRAVVILGGVVPAPDDAAEEGGGDGGAGRAASGVAAWDPAAGTWAALEPAAPIDGPIVGAVWVDRRQEADAPTGDGRILWWDGTLGLSGPSADGARPAGGLFDPATGAVDPIADPPFTMRRDEAPLLWAPELAAAVTWGGACGEGCNQAADDGALYDVAADRWLPLPPAGLGRRHAAVVWTGRELVVVGGSVADQTSQEFGEAVDGALWRA